MNEANLKRTVLREKHRRRGGVTRKRVGAPVTTDQIVLSLSLSLFVVHSSTCHLGCYIKISTERSDICSASKMGEQTLDVYTKRFTYNGTRWTLRACYRQDVTTLIVLTIRVLTYRYVLWYIECSRTALKICSLPKKYNSFVFSNIIKRK